MLEWYPGKFLRKLSGQEKKKFSVVHITEYTKMLSDFESLERRLAILKEIDLLGTQYFPKLLSYPICIAKELLKWAIKTMRFNDLRQLEYLTDNPHIQEEIDVLQKVLRELKEDLTEAKARGEI